MYIIGFWKNWWNFLKANAVRHMKRISISVGAFLFMLVISIPLGLEAWLISVYAGSVEVAGIILMSLFGKNGNGQALEQNSQNSTNNKLN